MPGGTWGILAPCGPGDPARHVFRGLEVFWPLNWSHTSCLQFPGPVPAAGPLRQGSVAE